MKCQILFSGKNKKTIMSLSSAEFANRVVKVKVNSSPGEFAAMPQNQTT